MDSNLKFYRSKSNFHDAKADSDSQVNYQIITLQYSFDPSIESEESQFLPQKSDGKYLKRT